MTPEEVQPAEAGEVNLLKVRLQDVLGIASDAPPAVCYCVLSRPGGFLLVLPNGVFSPGILQEAADLGYPGVIGPSTVISAPAVELSESGDWIGVYPPRQLEVTLIDFGDSAAVGLEPLLEDLHGCTPFLDEAPMLFPLATSVTAQAVEWTTNMDGERGAGYITAEELLPEPAVTSAPPLMERRAKAEPRPKKPTIAALASQQDGIMQALQALSAQVQQLAKPTGPPAPAKAEAAQVLLSGNRAALAAPISAAIAPAPSAPGHLAGLLESPPKGKAAAPVVVAGAPGGTLQSLLDGDPLDEPVDQEAPIASALLAQSKALTALVAHMTSGSDPLSDLAASSASSLSVKGSAARMKLQRELHGRSGGFFLRVQEAARRRMEPTAQLSSLPDELQRLPVMTRYLERFGGFRDQRTWGLVMWQLAQIFDLLASDQIEGAKDVLALLMVMVDQTVLDSGHPELGWILSLQEDPPGPLFSAAQIPAGSAVRPCSHLADPKWLAVALSYVKEMETLTTKRAELTKGKASGSASEVAPKAPAPALSKKQQRAKLWAERKAAVQPKS